MIPVCVFWAFVEPVFLALGQPPQLSKDVQRFLRVLIIGAPAYIGFESLKKYLQCQGTNNSLGKYGKTLMGGPGIMRASTMVLLVIFPINLGVGIGLIHHTSLGLLGSPLALSITYWLSFALLALYTKYSPMHRRNGTWGGFQLRLVCDPRSCWEFLKLGIPGIFMVGTEWYILQNDNMNTNSQLTMLFRAAFEIVALAAGRLGELPLAAQSVIMTTDQSQY